MDIEFDDDESGFWEARAVYAMASGFHPGHQQEGDRALVDFLKEASLAHMNREAYAELRAAAGVRDGVWPSWSLLNHLWRRTFGASQLEEDLSAQRSEALARAERAEHAVFDALADAAEMTADRDHWRAEADRLAAQIAILEVQLARPVPGEPMED